MELKNLMEALQPTEKKYLEQVLSQPIKSIQENYSDIVLTDEEIAKAILDAKVKKGISLQYEENEKKRRRQSEILVNPFNTDQLILYCIEFFKERFHKDFIIDDDNVFLIEKLGQYFTNDPLFNVGDYSLKKGIMIMGPVGTGKSWIMSFFQKNKKNCFTVKSCRDVANDYLVYKEEVVDIYSTPFKKPLHDPSVFFQSEVGYCFDDLGTEQDKNSYGNKKDVMADILYSIYDKYVKKDFTKFHITTNLNEKELEQQYGSRLYSRFREMFNVFVYEGKDRRK